MSTTYGTKLICGVPITKLGEVVMRGEVYELYNRIGQKTGQSVTIRKIYLEIGQRQILLASNENKVIEGAMFPDLDVSFHILEGLLNGGYDPRREDVPEIWVHEHLAYDLDTIKQTVVGLEFGDDENTDFILSDEHKFAEVKKRVFKQLREVLGYNGKIHIIAQLLVS